MRFIFLILTFMFGSAAIAQDANAPPKDPLICEKRSNVDTCWQLGIRARADDPAAALAHYERSCDFRSQIAGCYEAGKIMLHNSDLGNYAEAYTNFKIVCESSDIGFGPYACKFLGWMHHTGIGAARDDTLALDLLSKACFFHNDLYFTDPEGCHFLAENILAGTRVENEKQLLAYIALSMGCMDHAEGLCDDAQAFYAAADATQANWINDCDAWLGSLTYETSALPEGFACKNLPDHSAFVPRGSRRAHQLNQLTRQYLTDMFSELLYVAD